jgi:hypothetical protein
MSQQSSYDEKCEELARYFLEGEEVDENDIKELAQVIQDRIELWLTSEC